MLYTLSIPRERSRTYASAVWLICVLRAIIRLLSVVLIIADFLMKNRTVGDRNA